MNTRRVVITGIGAVTPLGLSMAETWTGLLAGTSGCGPITRFDTGAMPVNVACEVKGFTPETYMDARVMWQRLGTALPQPVFGPTVTPQLGLVRLDVGQLLTVPGSRWVVARTTDTTVPEGKLFALRLAELGQPNARWQRLATEADRVVDIALQGDQLYVMTQAGAPRRKVVRIDLKAPVALANAPVVAAEPQDGVLEGFDLTPTALIAQWRQGTSVLLRRYARGYTTCRNLPLPAACTSRMTRAPSQDSETLPYVFSSWT